MVHLWVGRVSYSTQEAGPQSTLRWGFKASVHGAAACRSHAGLRRLGQKPTGGGRAGADRRRREVGVGATLHKGAVGLRSAGPGGPQL